MQQWTFPPTNLLPTLLPNFPSDLPSPSLYPAWGVLHARLARLRVAMKWAALFVT